MAYPDSIEQFIEKLNKKHDDSTYVVEEKIELVDDKYEGLLKHDNINDISIKVYTGSKLTGIEIKNFIISVPNETPWKKSIKIFSNASPVYITYETQGDQVEAEDINILQDSITATQTEVDRYKNSNNAAVQSLDARLGTAEANKAEKVYVDTQLLLKADKSTTYTKTETDERIQLVIDAAPEALDTLKEIADALNNDPDFAATVTTELSKKVDKVQGKQLSTEDYTTTEKSKLAGIAEGANKYKLPDELSPDIIKQDDRNRFVSDVEKANWNDANTRKHDHSNKSVIDKITQALVDSWNSAVLHLSDSVRHITSVERSLWNTVTNKVDKVTGKGLSTEDYSTAEKNKLAGLENYEHPSEHSATMITEDSNHKFVTEAEKTNWNSKASGNHNHDLSYEPKNSNIQNHIANRSNPHTVSKADVGLGNVDNTSDLDKPISTATQSALNHYVTQNQLSTAGYGDMLKSVYDKNNNGKVDSAESADSVLWSGVSGKPSVYTPSTHTHDISAINGLQTGLDFKVNYSGTGNGFSDRTNLAVGWYTIAVNSGTRAVARFALRDINSGDHQSVVFYASHHFGSHSDITILHHSRFGGSPFKYIRIKECGTYDGAALQVYIDDNTNCVSAYLLGDNFQASGWVMKDFVPNAIDPGGIANYSALINEAVKMDLDLILGGIATSGELYSNTNKVWHAGNLNPSQYLKKGTITWNQIKGV